MYFTSIFAFVFAVVTTSAFAAVHPRGQPGPDSSRCYTQVARTSAHHGISTDWHTSFTHCTVTSTKIVKTTVTPRSTITSTVTKTSTVSKASSVAAPATFIPIQSCLPGSTYGGSGGADPVREREIKNIVLNKRASSSKPGLVPQTRNRQYPQGVSCYRWKPQCTTKIVTSTETITKHSTKLKTITSTKTETSTSYTTTVYAACATDNLADAYNGAGFITVTGGFSAVSDTTAASAYDCCVAAITFNGPGVSPDTSVWAFQPGVSGANCFIGTTAGTCASPGTNPSVAITGPGGSIVIGNSYCGEVNSALAELIPSSSSAVKRAAATAR